MSKVKGQLRTGQRVRQQILFHKMPHFYTVELFGGHTFRA